MLKQVVDVRRRLLMQQEGIDVADLIDVAGQISVADLIDIALPIDTAEFIEFP